MLGRLDMSVPTLAPPVATLPEPEIDIDKETLNDPFQVSIYAHHIFNYLKSREVRIIISLYISN